MKLTYKTGITVWGSSFSFIMAAVASLVFAGQVNAQYKTTGEDGIAASPKVRAFLTQKRASDAHVQMTSMTCPKCKDGFVSAADKDPKGLAARALMSAPSKLTARHLCDGCGVDWNVIGAGKAKQAVATHSCDGCGTGDLACCSRAVASKGMGQKVDIAPLK